MHNSVSFMKNNSRLTTSTFIIYRFKFYSVITKQLNTSTGRFFFGKDFSADANLLKYKLHDKTVVFFPKLATY